MNLAAELANQLGMHTHPLVVVSFLTAILFLDYFDISLPRGDSIGVSGAVSAIALVLIGPTWAAVASLGGLALAGIFRPKGFSFRRLAVALSARVVALLVATILLAGLGGVSYPWSSLAVALLVPAAFLLVEMAATQAGVSIGTGRPLVRLLRGNLSREASLLAAQWSVSVLLLITYGWTPLTGNGARMGNWSLVPVVALLFLMRQSYSLLLHVRETYSTTIEILVEAAEWQDQRRIGHSDRTAFIAREIAMRAGVPATQVETISLAALLHDVGAIGGAASPIGGDDAVHGTSSAVLDGVSFLGDVVPVLRLCEGDEGLLSTAEEQDLYSAFIVALASDADAANHNAVSAAHNGSAVGPVAPYVPASAKSRAVAAALALGYKTAAVH